MSKKPPFPDLPDIEKDARARPPTLTEDLAPMQPTDDPHEHTKQRDAERPRSFPAATEKAKPNTPTKRERAAADTEDHTKRREKFSDEVEND